MICPDTDTFLATCCPAAVIFTSLKSQQVSSIATLAPTPVSLATEVRFDSRVETTGGLLFLRACVPLTISLLLRRIITSSYKDRSTIDNKRQYLMGRIGRDY